MYVNNICKYEKDPIKISRGNAMSSFPHYDPMGDICCHENQSSDLMYTKALHSVSRAQMMFQLKFDYNCPTDIRV